MSAKRKPSLLRYNLHSIKLPHLKQAIWEFLGGPVLGLHGKLDGLKTERLHQYLLNFSNHNLGAPVFESFILYFVTFHFILAVTHCSSCTGR